MSRRDIWDHIMSDEAIRYDDGVVDPATRDTIAITLGFTAFIIAMGVVSVLFPSASDWAAFAFAIIVLSTGIVTGIGANKILKYHKRGCGCFIEGRSYGYRVAETEDEWQRTEDGAKVRWELYRTELRRCEKCGGHYHEDVDRPVKQREAWAEEEPEIMPDELEIDREL